MNIDTTFRKLAECNMKQKELESEIESLKEEIKSYMITNKVSEVVGKEHKATYKEITQTKIDRKKLEEDHPRIAKKYTTKSSYMRLNFA